MPTTTGQTKTRHSIRRLYLYIAVFVTLFLLFATLSLQYYVAYKSNTNTRKLEEHSKILKYVYQLRSAIARGDNILNDHLLSSSKSTIDKWDQQYRTITVTLKNLQHSAWSKRKENRALIQLLRQDLAQLNTITKDLISIRMSFTKQFPAIYYGQVKMLPLHRKFLSNSQNALSELDADSPDPYTRSLYQRLNTARWYWIQIIANFRMYLINRLASLSVEALESQIKDIHTYHKVLQQTLNAILREAERPENTKDLELEVRSAIENMLTASNQWYGYFRKTVALNASRRWRTDRILRTEKLQPLKQKIDARLQELISAIDSLSRKSLYNVAQTADDIVNTLWLLSLLGLLSIVAAYRYFDSRVIRPVSNITNALKAVAMGDKDIDIPDSHFLETENLIQAFSHMRMQIHLREEMLEHQALHDPMTKLPNRLLLEEQIHTSMHATDAGKPLTLLLLDLNDFKDINDSLGHNIGDKVLQQTAKRLLSQLRDTDMVARLGGDEFAILLPDTDAKQATVIAGKLAGTINKVFAVGEHSLYIGASIGIAVYPDNANSPESLLKAADVAMYVAKRKGHEYSIYNSALSENTSGNFILIDELGEVIKKGQLELLYQPILDTKTDKCVGAETVLRWQHETLGTISALDILTTAEHQGHGESLFKWILQNAFDFLSQAGEVLDKDFMISVKPTLLNLKNAEFTSTITSMLEQSGTAPRHLLLELPDNSIPCNNRIVLENLKKTSDLGVKLAIGNFIAGPLSLETLQRSPVDILKINGDYINAVPQHKKKTVLLRAASRLAAEMALKVLATGVEHQAALDLLKTIGTDYYQGNLASAPLSAQQAVHWIETAAGRMRTL